MQSFFSKISFLLLITILFSNCNKGEDYLFQVSVPLSTFIIESTFSPFNTHYVPGNDGIAIMANIEQQIAEAGYEMSDITEIVPGAAQLSAVFDEHTLEFIQAMSIRICTQTGPNCGKEVFYRDPVPENEGFSMGLIPSAIGDIQDILLSEQFFIQLKLEELRYNAGLNFQVRLEMDFNVR